MHARAAGPFALPDMRTCPVAPSSCCIFSDLRVEFVCTLEGPHWREREGGALAHLHPPNPSSPPQAHPKHTWTDLARAHVAPVRPPSAPAPVLSSAPSLFAANQLGRTSTSPVMGIPIREREPPSLAKTKSKAVPFKNNYIQVRCSDQVPLFVVTVCCALFVGCHRLTAEGFCGETQKRESTKRGWRTRLDRVCICERVCRRGPSRGSTAGHRRMLT